MLLLPPPPHLLAPERVILILRMVCRHEFLGPAPRVAGYRITPSDEIHILWYDGLVEERWCEREDGWKGEVYEANGEWKEQTEVD